MGGIDLRDRFLRWLASPACSRFLGVQHPVSGVLSANQVFLFGPGPPRGLNDACVKSVLKVAQARCPRLEIVDFAGDLRSVEVGGEHDALAADMTGAMSLLSDMGAKYHTKEGKRWWPTHRIRRIEFEVDTC